MTNVLVRNIPPETMERLQRRARRNGRSLDEELTLIVSAAADSGERSDTERARIIRAMFEGRKFSDSTVLIREDRNRR